MPLVRIRREEMEIVKQAAHRVERRSNSKFIIDQSRVEIADDEHQAKVEEDTDDSKPPLLCD